MTENLWLYSAIPAGPIVFFVFLLSKLWKRRAERCYILLFSSLLLVNLLQLTGYIALSMSRSAGELFADAYMITLYFLFGTLLIVCASLHDYKKFNEQYLYAFLVVPLIVSILHLAGLVTDGYRFEQNALMHDDGPLAAVVDLYLLICCVGSVVALIINIRSTDDKTNLSKNIVGLIAFAPLVVSILVVILLSRTQYAIPVVVVGPVFFLYTGMMFYYIAQDEVIDITIGVRFIKDRLQLCHRLLSGRRNKYEVKQLMKSIEWQFIKESLYEHDNNIMETAEALGMNHNTIRTKMKEQEASRVAQTPLKSLKSRSL